MSADTDNFLISGVKVSILSKKKQETYVEMIFGITAVVISLVATVPYIFDILHRRVRPARASRIMLELLLVIALYQQVGLGGGWGMAVTAGEVVSCGVLLVLAVPYGVGGWRRTDIICYILLAIDLAIWWHTGSAIYGLCLTIMADLIAFWPTLYKTWREPASETALWYWSGVAAGCLSVLAVGSAGVAVLFPLYLALINFVEVVLVRRAHWRRLFFAAMKRYNTSI